jgi:hypothetical protein
VDQLKNLLLIVVACVFGFIGAVAGTMVSAHGGDNNLIHACVRNSSGAIRIVDANASCAGNETPLDWNRAVTGGGVSGLEVVSSQSPVIPDGRWSETVSCPSGKNAFGGGAKFTLADGTTETMGNPITNSYPIGNPPTGWTATLNVTDGQPVIFTVYSICANASP